MLEKLSEYIDDEMDAEDCTKLKSHTDACIGCHVSLLTLQRTVELCRCVPKAPVPAELAERLNSFFKGRPEKR